MKKVENVRRSIRFAPIVTTEKIDEEGRKERIKAIKGQLEGVDDAKSIIVSFVHENVDDGGSKLESN